VLAGVIAGYVFDALDFMVLAMIIPHVIQDWGLSLVNAGLLSTATLFGAALGAYTWGPIADKFGRKYVIAACIATFSVMSFFCGLAQTWEQLMVLRFFAGVGLGGEWVIGAALVTEFFPPHQRARATTAVQMGWPIGFALAIAANYIITPLYGWRALFFFGAAGIVVTIYCLIFVPESPAWIRAKENLRKGVEGVSSTVARAVKWTEIFKGSNRRVTVLSICLCVCVLVSFWGTGTWIPAFLAQERGLDIRGLTWFLMGQQVAGMLSYVLFGYIADKVGRRASLIAGGLASTVTVILYMLAPTPGLILAAGLLWGFAMLGFWGPLPATIAEQFPTSVRGIGVSVSYATGRLASALSPFLIGGLGTKFGLAFAIGVMALFYLGVAVFGYLMKETKDTVVVD
jgi:MFS family permease